DIGQLLELVVHAGELAFDFLRGAARGDVQVNAAVRRASASPHLGADSASHYAAGEQLGRPAGFGPFASNDRQHPAGRFVFRLREFAFVAIGNVLEHGPPVTV